MSNAVRSVTAVNERRVALATLVGTTVEFYDFFVFGTASALVFGPLFFAPAPPTVGLVLAMATFGVSFLVRPVGGVIAGHLGDRFGRRIVLVWTMAAMGIATTAIGVLPTYAAAGAAAPLLLIFFRLVQGVAVGGEWGGAATMAIENAPAGRRGLWGSLPQMGGPLGLVLANAVTLVVTASMSSEAFDHWGWRVPFVVNLVLVAFGLWVRARVEDAVGDALATDPATRLRRPIREVLESRLGVTVKLIGAQAGINVGFYVFAVLALSYLTADQGVARPVALTAVLVGAGVDVVLQPVFGALSDRVGRKPLLIAGAVVSALLAFPYYAMASSGSAALVVVATVLALGLGHAPAFAVLSAMIGEQYDASHRYSGSSIANQLGNLVWAAGTPVLGVWLLGLTGGAGWPLAVLLVVACLIALACAAGLRETHRRPHITDRADADSAPEPGSGLATDVAPTA